MNKTYTLRFHRTSGKVHTTINGEKQPTYKMSEMEVNNWIAFVRKGGHTVEAVMVHSDGRKTKL